MVNRSVVCAVWDARAELFMELFSVPSEAVAVRWFEDHVRGAARASGQARMVHDHAEDFSLMRLSVIEVVDGRVGVQPALETLAQASKFVVLGDAGAVRLEA